MGYTRNRQRGFHMKYFLLLALLLLGGCQAIQDAQKTVADLQKTDAAQVSTPCANYKIQYIQTGDSTWLAKYNSECQDSVIAQNTPAGLSADCKTRYAAMVRTADSIVMSLRGQCDQTNLDTTASCIAGSKSIENLTTTFQSTCKTDAFYYPTVDEASVKTATVNGKCTWQAFIPPQTRLTLADSTASVLCTDVVPQCTKVNIRDTLRIVEAHQTIAGDSIYLPCLAEVQNAFAPCDFNQDRYVDPLEAQKCQQQGVNDPCDWNNDGKLDEFEKSQCEQQANSGVVNPNLYDPCDWNYDGKVDEKEAFQCHSTYACKLNEQPFYDPAANKTICIIQTQIPQCNYPTWAELVNGKVVCMQPCDFNKDGTIDSTESAQCTSKPQCGIDSIPLWDDGLKQSKCFAQTTMPKCIAPQFPDIVNGTVQCVMPCDKNRDGLVDPTEASQCQSCDAPSVPIWDPTNMKNTCSQSIACPAPSKPILVNGIATCSDLCDTNYDGIVDTAEALGCMPLKK